MLRDPILHALWGTFHPENIHVCLVRKDENRFRCCWRLQELTNVQDLIVIDGYASSQWAQVNTAVQHAHIIYVPKFRADRRIQLPINWRVYQDVYQDEWATIFTNLDYFEDRFAFPARISHDCTYSPPLAPAPLREESVDSPVETEEEDSAKDTRNE